MQKTKKAEGRRAMSVQLLDKTRKINKLLHNNNSSKVVFNDICEVLSEILESNVLVISKKGKVLGIGDCIGVDEIHELIVDQVGSLIDPLLNERLLGILSTKENVNLQTLGFDTEDIRKYHALVTPIDIAGERLGTLFMYKYENDYDIDDIILSEYGTTVVGLEMMRSVHEENAEEIRNAPGVWPHASARSARRRRRPFEWSPVLSWPAALHRLRPRRPQAAAPAPRSAYR